MPSLLKSTFLVSTLAALAAAGSLARAAETGRETVRFDHQWQFHFGDVPEGQSPDLDASAWRTLDVPHDWSIEGVGAVNGLANLPQLNAVDGTWHYHHGDHREWKNAALDVSDWKTVQLPARWEGRDFPEQSYIWFRRTLTIPAELQGKPFALDMGKIDDADETYLNGHKLGATGRMPPHFQSAWQSPRRYRVDPKLLNAGGENVLAVRVYNGAAQGGIYESPTAQSAAIEGPFNAGSPAGAGGGYLDGGIAWYRKTFTLPPHAKKRQVSIEFDGVYMDSDVWLNGEHLGNHPYGFTSFRYDLTPHLKWDGRNVLAVRVNVVQPCCRWYSGAGIYRHVRLVLTDPVHVAHWGTYVTTPEVTRRGGHREDANARCQRRSRGGRRPTGYDHRRCGRLGMRGQRDPPHRGRRRSASLPGEFRVKSPRLWSLDKPQLYTAVSRVYVGGRLVDEYTTPFGIRTIEFTDDKGFFLNGQHVPLQGVCDHHDLGCLGSAVNRRAIQRQLEILKSMGCNAIRTSHNPPAPGTAGPVRPHGLRRDGRGLRRMEVQQDAATATAASSTSGASRTSSSMLDRDRNHPSVILWSIGNEINEQGAGNGGAMATRLADFCRREDPTRPVTSACSNPGGANGSGYAKALDVFGINYNIGAYYQFKDKYTLLGSETSSALSTRDAYNLVPECEG